MKAFLTTPQFAPPPRRSPAHVVGCSGVPGPSGKTSGAVELGVVAGPIELVEVEELAVVDIELELVGEVEDVVVEVLLVVDTLGEVELDVLVLVEDVLAMDVLEEGVVDVEVLVDVVVDVVVDVGGDVNVVVVDVVLVEVGSVDVEVEVDVGGDVNVEVLAVVDVVSSMTRVTLADASVRAAAAGASAATEAPPRRPRGTRTPTRCFLPLRALITPPLIVGCRNCRPPASWSG